MIITIPGNIFYVHSSFICSNVHLSNVYKGLTIKPHDETTNLYPSVQMFFFFFFSKLKKSSDITMLAQQGEHREITLLELFWYFMPHKGLVCLFLLGVHTNRYGMQPYSQLGSGCRAHLCIFYFTVALIFCTVG